MHDRVAVVGEICTSGPEETDFPVRVLFAVDSSDSMIFNDPNNLNVDALEGVVERLRDNANVSFGILRWGERTVWELSRYAAGDPVLFTKDETLLGEAFARMRQLPVDNPDKYLGGTDYVLALDEVRAYIMQDIAENPSTATIHQYYVEFITDGMPQSGTSDPTVTRSAIIIRIDALRTDFNLRLDVASIVEIATVTPEFFDLLPTMASSGGGSFMQLSAPESLQEQYDRILTHELFLLEYELATVNAPDDPKSVGVINSNMRIAEVEGVIGLYVDSDTDGLVDAAEKIIGTNPRHPDSDRDGLDDLFEQELLGEFDPLAQMSPDLSQEQLLDEDRDGLIAFVELRLGTDPKDPDTDRDGLPDGVEYRSGTDPRVDDTGADPDGDNLSNAFELRQHTNPHLAEPLALHAERSYKVLPVGDFHKIFDGRRCYGVSVDNVTLGETLEAVDLTGKSRPQGFNRITLWRLERPVDRGSGTMGGSRRRFTPGEIWMVFRPFVPMRDPTALELRVGDANFEP